MSPFSLLLRVLLCVTLIANGIGFAQASTRMQLAHASHGTHGERVQTRAAAPAQPTLANAGEECHPGMTMASHAGAEPPVVDHAAMVHGGNPGAESGAALADAMDCCDGKNCQCACTQHASAAFIAELSPGAPPVHTAALMGGTSQHASPRLPHLIRPPIG